MENVEVDLTVDHADRVIRVRIQGSIQPSNAWKLPKRPRLLASRWHYGIYYDCRGVDLKATPVELYKLPRTADVLTDPERKRWRAAFLVSTDATEDLWDFYVTTARNCGVNCRLFLDDERAALTWATGAKTK